MFKFKERFFDDSYFSSDSLNKGRIVKKVFKDLCFAMLEMAEDHGHQHVKIYKGELDYPFWHSEEKVGWMLPIFFHKQGYLVWSEWSEENLTKTNGRKANRKIDFLVAQQGLDLFIELKKAGARFDSETILYSESSKKLVSSSKSGSGLLEQVYNLKDITPNYNDNKVLSGILIVNTVAKIKDWKDDTDPKKYKKFTSQLLDEVNNHIDGRRNIHLIAQHSVVEWDKGDIEQMQSNGLTFIPKVISIIGVFCSPKE